jgi:Zn-finger nucleic acid-binding protein
MKKCPYCREEIKSEAVKCRFCCEWVEENIAEEKKDQPKIPERPLFCPKCKVLMNIVQHDGVETDECPECGGIWVDYYEEKQVLEMKPGVFTVDDLHNMRRMYKPDGKIEEVKYHKCPICSKLMWRKNYLNHSGVIVDKCREHGTFFDKGEIEKAIEFIKLGGVEYEKLRVAEVGIAETQSKIVKEINRVECNMYRLHWISRVLSLMGF